SEAGGAVVPGAVGRRGAGAFTRPMVRAPDAHRATAPVCDRRRGDQRSVRRAVGQQLPRDSRPAVVRRRPKGRSVVWVRRGRIEGVHWCGSGRELRVQELGWSAAAFGAGGVLTVALRLPSVVGLLFLFGLPLLTFLLIEQQLASESARWQRRVFLELPIVAE